MHNIKTISRSLLKTLETEFWRTGYNVPCIVTSAMDNWPALKEKRWNIDELINKIGIIDRINYLSFYF